MNNNSKKIALIQPELVYPRGAEKQVCELAHQLNGLGFDVTVYTFNYAKDFQFKSLLNNVKVVNLKKNYFPIYEGGETGGRYLHFFGIQLKNIYYTYLLSKIIGNNYIFINSHNYPAHWISFFVKTPVYWTCNEPPYWHYYKISLLYRLLFAPLILMDYLFSFKIKSIFCLDNRMSAILNRAYNKSVVKIGSGAGVSSETTHIKNNRIDILFVGELHPQKRPFDLLSAVASLETSYRSKISIHYVGGGELRKDLEQQADRDKVDCKFYGRAKNDVLEELYSLADLSVFVPENQPWGIFPLESVMHRIPTIISDQCGVTEVLSDLDVSVVKTGDIDALANKIILRIQNVDHKELRRDADIAKERFSWERYALRFLSHIPSA